MFALFAADPPMESTAPPWAQWFPFIVLMGLMFFFMISSGRRQKREQQNMLNSLKQHDKVVTHSGILGTIVNISENEVTLKVDETTNSRMRVLKTAIASVVKAGEEPKGSA